MENLPEKLQNNLIAPTPSYTNITDGYQAALKVVDDVILKNYVSELSNMEIVPLSRGVLESNIRDNVRFFKITEMVYEKGELATYKFASVFNALSITDSTVFIIIDSDGVETDFYMGVRSQDEYRTISRIGSNETKSLIMGLLIMRLSEYRMSSSEEMNASLHHITVLEEAHNILKRTSTDQNSEGVNVAGKSVEMISNAIAEMRTYGEGFIIADQSPNAVDISAIRNTNTKIIMRLPDEQDRRLAGKSAGLKDNQLDEITKLPKGVAVVYQNDWLEPVLCKIEKFKGEEHLYKKCSENAFSFSGIQKRELILNLLKKNAGESLDLNIGELTDMLIGMNISASIKMKALKALRINGACSLNNISPVIYELICDSTVEKEAENVDSIEEWRDVFLYAQDALLASFDSFNQNKAIECILREQIERYNKPIEYLDTWNEFLKKEVM